MRKFLSAAAIAFTLSGPAYAQDWDKGLAAYQAGDYATALREWRPLAEQGNAMAQYVLGVMYRDGQGVPQDYRETEKWYQKAAAQGFAPAQFNLGVMYEYGQGVPQDHKEALKWYRKAAEQGDADAQTNLGSMYVNGKGVLQDNVLAYMWYNISSTNGDEIGAVNRGEVAKLMTPEQISEAQAMALECISTGYKSCGD